jgi:hypothetical protein
MPEREKGSYDYQLIIKPKGICPAGFRKELKGTITEE